MKNIFFAKNYDIKYAYSKFILLLNVFVCFKYVLLAILEPIVKTHVLNIARTIPYVITLMAFVSVVVRSDTKEIDATKVRHYLH